MVRVATQDLVVREDRVEMRRELCAHLSRALEYLRGAFACLYGESGYDIQTQRRQADGWLGGGFVKLDVKLNRFRQRAMGVVRMGAAECREVV